MKLVYENRLNVLLSELLNQMGVISHSEQLNRGRKDIVVYNQGLRLVIEGSYDKTDAERDAEKRMEQLPVDAAIAIHYPHEFPQQLTEPKIKEKLKTARFGLKVIVAEDISGTLYEYFLGKRLSLKPGEWIDTDLTLLSNVIREVGQFIISEKHVKEVEGKVEKFINDFVTDMSFSPQSVKIAENLYRILYELYGFSIGDPKKIKEVIFAQAGLALLLSSIYYESIRYAHNLDSLRLRRNYPLHALQKAVEDILEINYEPIFETAKQILYALPQTISERLLQCLIDLACEISAKKSLLRRDIAGYIYHKIVGDWSLRKGLATYFTQIPAAYLLLYLANPSANRICDFACGSGTLLTAAYSVLRSKYGSKLLKEGIDRDPNTINEEFHRQFIASCYGFDVLRYAVQITGVNLALHNPEVAVKEFNLYTLPLGFRQNKDELVSLGSLEFSRTPLRLNLIFGKGAKKFEMGGEVEKLLKLEHFDLIAMNPPFSRATGRGGREGGGLFGFIADESVRERVVRDYEELREHIREQLLNIAKKLRNRTVEAILKDKDFKPYRAIGQAGEGLLFLYLADKYLKKGGKLCFVLPKNLLSGVSWFLARTLLASKYHIEHIVVSYDSENGYNFSESTSLSECLLIARKKGENKNNENNANEITRFVMLLRKPTTSVEAIALANQLLKTDDSYVEAGNSQAFVVKVDRNTLAEYIDNWGRFVFLPNLAILDELNNLLSGIIRLRDVKVEIPMTKLNDIITSIGVDRHQFSDNFRIVRRKVPGCLNVLHGGGEDIRRFMAVKPNTYALPKNKGEELFKKKSGKLLLPDRIWVDTAHVISMVSEKPTLSNIFYAVRLRDEDKNKLKALCLWFNTTWGILTVLANRQETRGAWITLKMTQWKLLPVLDITKLEEDKLKRLARVFDEFKDKDLGRIPEQFVNYDLRLELDKAFLKAVGAEVDEDALTDLYGEIRSSMEQWIG